MRQIRINNRDPRYDMNGEIVDVHWACNAKAVLSSPLLQGHYQIFQLIEKYIVPAAQKT